MKSVLTITTCLFLAGSYALADLKIPSSVFEMEELEEAKSKAIEANEPLIFVVTNPGTT